MPQLAAKSPAAAGPFGACPTQQPPHSLRPLCLLQTDIQQREALVHFHAPDYSQTSLQQKALLQQGPLEPALHSRRQQLLARTAELKMKARELDAALQVCSLTACCCSTSCSACCCVTPSANNNNYFCSWSVMQLHAA